MQSKNKRAPTVAERAHIERVQALRCSVCEQSGPSEVHEIKQGQWFSSVALCPDCHRGGSNGLHGNRRMWLIKKLDEVDALAITIERLMSPAARSAPNAEHYDQEQHMATKKMTEKQDEKMDKKAGIKENSKRDMALDSKSGVGMKAPAMARESAGAAPKRDGLAGRVNPFGKRQN